MLLFFRRHRGAFLIVLTTVIIISFSVWGGWKQEGAPMASSSDTAFTMYGKDYTVAEMQRLERYMQLMGMLQLFDLGQGLMMVAQEPETRGSDFVVNLVVLKHEMKEMGIHPSDAEAKAALEQLPSLQENGQFSPQRAHMIERSLGMYGFDGSDMLEAMKLSIGFKKLQDLIGKNYTPSPIEVEKSYASRHQTLKISTIDFALEDFKKQVQVTDEETQKYYEENKENYKTPERRAVSYVYFAEAAEPEAKPAEGKPAEDKPAEDKPAEEEAPKEKSPEERQKAQQELVDRVNKFNDATLDSNANFDELAKTLNEKVITLPAFTRDDPPEAIKEEAELITAIFHTNQETRPISDPIKGSKGGYYIFTVTAVEAPKLQELAEVKGKVEETLKAQRAQEALSKAVNDARTAIQDGLKAGKKIDELAKEKQLTLSPETELDVAQPAPELENGYQLAREAEHTPAGGITRAIDTEKGATLVFVHAKELRKREDSAALRKNTEDATARMERMRIFNAWFNRKRQEAKLKLRVQMA